MAAAQKEADKYGLNVFQKTTDTTSKKGLTGAISGLTEGTASALEGNLTAMRITNASIDNRMRESLVFLSGIERNTGNIDLNTATANNKLDKIIDALNKDPLRAKGLPG